MKKKWFAYQLTSNDAFDVGVEQEAEALLKRLAEDLEGGDELVMGVTIGMVYGDTVDDAMTALRLGKWVPESDGGFFW